MSNYRLGIDFGTSFCFSGMVMDEEVKPLNPHTEQMGIPSVFYADEKGARVGIAAERYANSKPEQVIRSIKRRLTDRGTILRVGNKSYGAQDIVQEILRHIMDSALQVLTESYVMDFGPKDILEVVITVPVTFGEQEKEVIRQAVSRIRLPNDSHPVLTGMIPEPVAAAIQYFGTNPKQNQEILVVDLGGGTLDLAWIDAVENADPPYQVRDHEGDRMLGGDDWDEVLVHLLQDRYREEYGSSPPDRYGSRLLADARAIKIDLSGSEETDYNDLLGDSVLEGQVTRAEFERLSVALVKRVTDVVARLMSKQKGKVPDQVILTGGACRMPMIVQAIRARFPKSEVRLFEPEHAICYGAARFAASLNWDHHAQSVDVVQPIIQTIATHGYGISYYYEKYKSSRVHILIPKGAKLPFTGKCTSQTREKGQKDSVFEVYETGKDTQTDDVILESEGRMVMEVVLRRERAVPIGTESKEILTLGNNGLLKIRATDKVNHVEVEDEITIKHW